MTSKRCFKCGLEKPTSEFYSHSKMADGFLGKCKECTRKDVRANRAARRDYYAQYDAKRLHTPQRQATIRSVQQRRKENDPDRYRAHFVVSHALRDKRLFKQPCEVCGTTKNVQAHHDDYSKPLQVRWLCFKHHREVAHGQVVING